jgi:hypothetical protein
MSESHAPEFARWASAQRKAGLVAAEAPASTLAAGNVGQAATATDAQASDLLRAAIRQHAGLIRPTQRTEIVWVQGGNEIAIDIVRLRLQSDEGSIRVLIPVRTDQTGRVEASVTFAVGSERVPAGLYASTFRRPVGPELIVALWGDALVALAWQGLLGLATGIAAALGKDSRGNRLVPVELVAGKGRVRVVPMARHRFMGSSGLKPVRTAAGKP